MRSRQSSTAGSAESYLRIVTSRSGIIARAAAKEAIRQPVFPLLLALSILMLVVNTFVPFFSLGEDVKMLEICGMATMLICGMLLAVWTSSMSIAEEMPDSFDIRF